MQIDISIDVASAAAYVTDYDCTNSADKQALGELDIQYRHAAHRKNGTQSGGCKGQGFLVVIRWRPLWTQSR